MSTSPPAAELVEHARALYERGASLRDVGREVGKSRETVRRWATAGQWKQPETMLGLDHQPRPVPSTEELEQARLRAEKASQEARMRWGVRRSEEADAAGISAGVARQDVLRLLKADRPADARHAAFVYQTFVTAANLLSGDSNVPRGRQGDEDGPSVHGPRPTDPAEMAAAGRARALQLVRPPTVTVESREA